MLPSARARKHNDHLYTHDKKLACILKHPSEEFVRAAVTLNNDLQSHEYVPKVQVSLMSTIQVKRDLAIDLTLFALSVYRL